jgi:uncharacterized protein (DUF934 family)
MALINNRAQVIEDGWRYPGAGGGEGAIQPNSVVPLDVLAARARESLVCRPIGAFAASGVTVEQIVPMLDRLDLVVVEFPRFRDGRGFTVARALRERHGFAGDIRAIGHVLPDQLAALAQCGFTSIVTPAEHPPEQWRQSASGAAARMGGGPLLQRLMGPRASPLAKEE